MAVAQKKHTSLFKALTIASSGFGGGALGLWAFSLANSGQLVSGPGMLIAGLTSLAAAGCALAFFEGFEAHESSVQEANATDSLTGLPSRRTFLIETDRQAALRQAEQKTTYFIDIEFDRFKQINDALGYRTGDRLIGEAVKRLKALLPPQAYMGRIGASEFGIVLDDEAALPALEIIMDRVLDGLTQPFVFEDRRVMMTVSCGVTEFGIEPLEQSDVLKRASLALHRSRAKGRNCWCLFEPELGRVAENRRWLEAEMQGAIDRRDFELHYQPQLDLATGTVVGYEALVRWRHPEKGLISPVDFIPCCRRYRLDRPARRLGFAPGLPGCVAFACIHICGRQPFARTVSSVRHGGIRSLGTCRHRSQSQAAGIGNHRKPFDGRP